MQNWPEKYMLYRFVAPNQKELTHWKILYEKVWISQTEISLLITWSTIKHSFKRFWRVLVIQISCEEPLQTHTKIFYLHRSLLEKRQPTLVSLSVEREGKQKSHSCPIQSRWIENSSRLQFYLAVIPKNVKEKKSSYWWPVNFFIKLFHNLLFSISEFVVVSDNHNLWQNL